MTSENIKNIGIVTMFTILLINYLILRNRFNHMSAELKSLSIGYNAAIKLLLSETKRREEHTKALKRLTDPESIADDMEKGARVREMYDANRTTLPREDAGPPAKVYTPKMRAKVPRGNFRRPRD